MRFRVDITDLAQRDIDQLARYCRDYEAAFLGRARGTPCARVRDVVCRLTGDVEFLFYHRSPVSRVPLRDRRQDTILDCLHDR
jgi:hypothetical protein